MTIFRPMHWTLCWLAAALAVAGCSSETTSGDTTGSLSLNLELLSGVVINQVDWAITGGDMEPMGGSIDTSAPGATASVEVFGLPPGDDYVVELAATSEDGDTTCKGSAEFDVEVGETTDVMVILHCKLPDRFGAVRVNGELNICAELVKAVVSPLQTSVGNDIDLVAQGEDKDGDPVTYMWSSGSGAIADPMAASTTYTCTEVGDDVITILVTDDSGTYCMDMYDFHVTCVLGEGDPCEGVICEDDGNECTAEACNPGTGQCETSNVDDGADCNDTTGMCMDGTCVDKDLCMDVVCEDDGNECTAEVCNPGTGVCETSNVEDGTSCGQGGACMGGTCIEADLCEGVTCEDTGNECTAGVCNSQTGVCEEMNVADGTACLDNTGTCLAGTCVVGNQCDGVDCSSGNDCVDGGTCNPSNGLCEGGGNEPINTPCDTDGVCDGQGTCVECNDGTQCPDDDNECTMAACDANQCGQSNVMNGMMCDFMGGMNNGVCDAGACVAAPECVSPGDCNDGNPCTSGDCIDGMCSFIPVDGGSCEVSVGVPGTCSGGNCVGLCDGVDCASNNQCVGDGTCNVQTGTCDAGSDLPADTGCTQNGGSVCDGQGNCVQCNSANQCAADGNECTAASCVDGTCGQANVADGTSCDGGSGECQAGACQPVGPPTYDLSASIFKPYNSLLSDLTGTGVPSTDCNAPNLTTAPGNNLTGINTKCLIILPPDVSGSMTFDETSAGVFDVTGVQNLSFVIDVTIAAVSAQVIITTNSSTAFSGTATGALPGTITMDTIGGSTPTFNVNAAATGNVNCQAFNTTSGADVSVAICPLANLQGGNNSVPLPNDPGRRTFPPLTVTNTGFQMGGGPSVVNGWYLSNPAPLAGNGTQWVALAGTRQ